MQFITSHVVKVNTHDKEKQRYLLRGLAETTFRQICAVRAGHVTGKFHSVAQLADHTLTVDRIMQNNEQLGA